MALTSGKIFTIEQLKKCDKFVWPDEATCACMDAASMAVDFYEDNPWYTMGKLTWGHIYYLPDFRVKTDTTHMFWKYSLVTREEYEEYSNLVEIENKKQIACNLQKENQELKDFLYHLADKLYINGHNDSVVIEIYNKLKEINDV